jgi:hypothetical protein
MSNWFTFPKNVPIDGQTVWIRITEYYSQPFQAVYNSSSQVFTSVLNDINFPAYIVARWAP